MFPTASFVTSVAKGMGLSIRDETLRLLLLLETDWAKSSTIMFRLHTETTAFSVSTFLDDEMTVELLYELLDFSLEHGLVPLFVS